MIHLIIIYAILGVINICSLFRLFYGISLVKYLKGKLFFQEGQIYLKPSITFTSKDEEVYKLQEKMFGKIVTAYYDNKSRTIHLRKLDMKKVNCVLNHEILHYLFHKRISEEACHGLDKITKSDLL